jgi:hypothetical protein
LFNRVLDRTPSRLDIPALRALFGLKNRPHSNRAAGLPAQEIVIERPQYGLARFRIGFGLLQLKAYTKGEHMLRFAGHRAQHQGAVLRPRESPRDDHPPGRHGRAVTPAEPRALSS